MGRRKAVAIANKKIKKMKRGMLLEQLSEEMYLESHRDGKSRFNDSMTTLGWVGAPTWKMRLVRWIIQLLGWKLHQKKKGGRDV